MRNLNNKSGFCADVCSGECDGYSGRKQLIQEAFEVEADEVGFCLDQKWGDYENPYENSDTVLAFNLFKKGWQAATAQAVPEGFVLVDKHQLAQLMANMDSFGKKALGDDYVSFADIAAVLDEAQEPTND